MHVEVDAMLFPMNVLAVSRIRQWCNVQERHCLSTCSSVANRRTRNGSKATHGQQVCHQEIGLDTYTRATLSGSFFLRRETAHRAIIVILEQQRHVIGSMDSASVVKLLNVSV